MSEDEIKAIDGRTARRQRGRIAVIDAVFELLKEGQVPPQVKDLAERSGVSVSSIFRYFDGLEDIQVQALDRFAERFSHLFFVEGSSGSPLDQRILSLVDSRLRMLDEVGGIIAVARLRSIENETFVEATDKIRWRLSNQVEDHFKLELDALTPSDAASLVSVIDSLASPEAWDVMRLSHGRTQGQIRSSWTQAISAVFLAWLAPNNSHNWATEEQNLD